ncbi:efflux RND transporter periplasmic adaptor subunit [Sutterella sp.]|uniref:efflux RND transporter periplasmic adaptor subunit n=1 Tax=Sutterella sp. TaxID=1981025 RepID=UPI0026E110EA|nr:efflux RND transporter periplasmic adaptor subunit [Sutterella sp.]MDO5530644.1 efflux RND transporter periplasmic adaptor subunit [Sutterella sp.]
MTHLTLPALLTAAAVLVLSGCTEEKTAPAPRAPLAVSSIVVKAADEAHWLETLGQAESGAGINVIPEASGRILAVRYAEGDLVKAGDVLFEIDPSTLRAQLEAAEATRRQSEDEFAQADREWKRQRNLFNSGAGSRKDLDDAASDRTQKRAALAQAKAAEAEARISLGHCEVKAPVAGYVSRALFNPGTVVVSQSSVLATITQNDDIRVVFAPSDRDLAGAELTKETRVRAFRSSGEEIPAEIDYVAQTYSSSNGTRTVRVKVPAEAGILPGEFLRIRYMTAVDRNAWRVPQRAVQQLPDGTYSVYVAKDGKAVAKAVEVGLWEGADWVIRSGLEDGDRVITSHLIRLHNGSAVTTEDAPAGKAN